jgi:hypothetical protein
MSDELWPYFAPLWMDARKVSASLLLAGGYGLFLKQKRLIKGDLPTVIEIGHWIDQTPRVTKDFDLIVEVSLIASPEQQAELHAVLEKYDFKAVPKNERWQFAKKLAENREVMVDFHAPEPTEDRNDVRVEDRRIKPKPSLGGVGIHGRKNPEAIGCEMAPFSFSLDDCEIVVPNPVTWSVMKLVAMRDQFNLAQASTEDVERRRYFTAQAEKHAQDVFRVVAMMTSAENDQAKSVLDALRSRPAFLEARSILKEFFGTESAFGRRAVQSFWQPDDAKLILEILAGWFQ